MAGRIRGRRDADPPNPNRRGALKVLFQLIIADLDYRGRQRAEGSDPYVIQLLTNQLRLCDQPTRGQVELVVSPVAI